MKNIFWIVLLLLGVASCTQEESVFEQTADERINAALDGYQQQLLAAPYGWKAVVYPGAGGVYSFYMNFNDKNRVTMYSDFSLVAASTAKESSYRLKALQTPSLLFDTYSYLHLLADPHPNVNGGNAGEGLVSDYEFSFQAESDNSENMVLIGTKNNTRMVLVKATQNESVAYARGDLAKSFLFANISKYPTYFKRITVGGVVYEIIVDQSSRNIIFNWLEGSTPKSFTTGYYYSSTGVSFISPFTNGSQTINGFSDIVWDATKVELGFKVNGNNVVVNQAAKPMNVNLQAARNWWNYAADKGSYWISLTGVTVQGQEDFYKVQDIPNYLYILFFPAFNTSGSTLYDAFAAYDGDAIMGPAVVPTFRTDGRITFSVLGTFGTNAAVNSQLSTMAAETNGFYLIQTSPLNYDMVSAKDGKTWISWWYPWQ